MSARPRRGRAGRWTLRAVVAGALGVLAGPGPAQPVAKPPLRTVGYLSMLEPGAGPRERCVEDLAAALLQRGWREGTDYRIAVAYAARDEAALARRAHELAGLRPDVLVAAGLHPVASLRQATRSIPIVALGTGYLQGAGLIESLGRPGTNVTGVSIGEREHGTKSLELLAQLLPGLRRVGLLLNRHNPGHQAPSPAREAVAERLQLQLVRSEFSGFGDLEAAWRRLAAAGVQAVFIQPDLGVYAEEHARLAMALGLPAMTHHHRFATHGGAFAYGYASNFCALGARYVDRILRGQAPRDLPVEEVWDVGLVINLRTLRRLGIVPPPAALARAVRVIE